MITVLKADKIDLAVLEAKYGFVTPQKVLQALQRDAIQKGDGYKDDIYEKPMVEVRSMIQAQRVGDKLVAHSRVFIFSENLTKEKSLCGLPPSLKFEMKT